MSNYVAHLTQNISPGVGGGQSYLELSAEAGAEAEAVWCCDPPVSTATRAPGRCRLARVSEA